MCNWLSCVRLGAGHFPVVLVFMMVVTLTSTYILAVYRGDVDAYFPYISDAGSKRPESCVFGLLLNMAAFLGIIIMYIRYRLVKELNRASDVALDRLNLAAFLVGCASSSGMAIVANFQISAVFIFHLIGAFVCFGAGLIYSILHTAATYRMYPLYNGITICRVRLLITLVALAAFFMTVITGSLAFSLHHRNITLSSYEAMSDLFSIDKNEPGYWLHISSAVGEWVLAAALLVFLMTYSKDFEKLRVTVAVEPLVAHLDESPARGPSLEPRNLLGAVS